MAVPTPVRVWDLPTRAFHWTLVALVVLQFGTAQFHWLSMTWHVRFGYATLALLLFRVAWGVVGSQTSRFADFVRGPVAAWRYVRALASGRAAHAVGHNVLGGWSVLLMLALLTLQALSGLFASDGIDTDGPFVDAVGNATVKMMTRVHHLGETALLVLIALHVVAVLLHGLLHHDNLVAPMLHGNKALASPPPLRFASLWRAALVLAIAAGLVLLLASRGT